MSYASQILIIGAIFFGILCCVLMNWRHKGSCEETLFGSYAAGAVCLTLLCFSAVFAEPKSNADIRKDAMLQACRMDSKCNLNAAITTITTGQ